MAAAVVFALTGPLAHFRKYYTNSSSLSYGFPTRPALMGLVAAIIGWERDTYYEKLGLQEARFAVVNAASVRRLIQTVNYVRTKKEDMDHLRKLGPARGTQVPLELLLPGSQEQQLNFRVYFAHRDATLVQEVSERLKDRRPHFPLYLGLTEFIAQGEHLFTGSPEKVHPPGEEVEVHSVLNAAFLTRLLLTGGITLNRERAPQGFGAGRSLQPPASFVYEASSRPFAAILSCPAYTFALPHGKETVVFMEGSLWDTTRT